MKPGTTEIFGVAVRKMREGALLSQQDFADRAGISVESVKRWERLPVVQVHFSSIRSIAAVVSREPMEVLAILSGKRKLPIEIASKLDPRLEAADAKARDKIKKKQSNDGKE